MKLNLLTGLVLLALSLVGVAQQTGSSGAGLGDEFDLNALVDRLSNSKSLGIFTKLSLKGDIDRLLKNVGDYHKGDAKDSLDQLRERYDAMVHKLVVLLQDKDEDLVKSIDQSRDRVWLMLADEKEFKRL